MRNPFIPPVQGPAGSFYNDGLLIVHEHGPGNRPTDPGWAGVPSARIGGASRPFDEDNNNFLVW
jgi:hypothetical protein